MKATSELRTEMPDIAAGVAPGIAGTLDWVGMSHVHQPLQVRDGSNLRSVEASVQVYVNLADAAAKGIHMSRLYLILDEHADTRPLTAAGLGMLLRSVLESHSDLSTNAFVQFEFNHFVRRKALISDHFGWASYPVMVKGSLIKGEVILEMSVEFQYSSTCPCSAALARQLIQEQFDQDFGAGEAMISVDKMRAWLGSEEGIIATPHSQRSTGKVLVRLDDQLQDFPITDLVDSLEAAVQTPVQSAVKREDEQEFARLNGKNLMFVEDASRRLKVALDDDGRWTDYLVRLEHHESLHAHDAVGVFTRGVENGYLPIP